MSRRPPRVAYFRHDAMSLFQYGRDHPMKPHRISMADSLVHSYGLHKKKNMKVYELPKAKAEDMMLFHQDDYVKFLQTADSLLDRPSKGKREGPESGDESDDPEEDEVSMLKARFNLDDDCPIFPGIFQFCQLSVGGSVEGARLLNEKECDIAINWSGGLHHAKRNCASGFCYVNDIVLAILELLKVHHRVLYVDIDVHHGDGVEEAFFTTNRVMTVSFHKYGNFFPHTGAVSDLGAGEGLGYALNFPLHDGMDDSSYVNLFTPVMNRIMEHYDPGAVVLQCGADSLSEDWLGPFNLSLDGHSACVEYFRDRGVPLMLLGGGGYTIGNVARCWAYETAVALDCEVPSRIPRQDKYIDYYQPDFNLQVHTTNRANDNTTVYLDYLKNKFMTTLAALPCRPSVHIGSELPHPFNIWQNSQEERAPKKKWTAEEIEKEFKEFFPDKPLRSWLDEEEKKIKKLDKEKIIKQSWDLYFSSRLSGVQTP